MDLVQWITFLGVPSLFSIIVAVLAKLRTQNKKLDLMMKAYQISIRDRLMQMYHKCMEYSCISDEDAELWEAFYQSYHALGSNGVMDSRKEQIDKLPKVTEYPEKE